MTHYCDVIVFSSFVSDHSIDQSFDYFLRYMKIKKLIDDMKKLKE